MSSYNILELRDVVLRSEELRFQEPINWTISSDQHWAIIGPNGSGKSMLVDTILGKYALHHNSKIICKDQSGKELKIRETIRAVAFKDIYTIIDTKESYYQQRWNKGLQENISKVKDIVAKRDQERLNELINWFHVEDLMEKEVNLLSSGELRKFLIISSLLEKPKILILDNPYIGLDTASRFILDELFEKLVNYKSLQIFLILSDPNEVPTFITHVLPIEKKKVEVPQVRTHFFANKKQANLLFNRVDNIFDFPIAHNSVSNGFEYAVDMKNIHIRYDNRTILKDVSWKVKKGEKWALLGPNGSGKSTLLSLVNGDNPQAYANDITLFDKKRGTGESIWDIKKRIGYVSPEMHLFYLKNVKCIDIVGSGFFDTIGLYKKCSVEEEQIAKQWMQIFGIGHLENISFLNVSTGEQRLLLIARVLVKNPDLLILDEPMHGLDVHNKRRVKRILEKFCDKDKTLIYVTHHLEEIPDIVDKRLELFKNK